MARKFQFVAKSGIEESTFDDLLRLDKKGKFRAEYESEKLKYTIEGTYKPDFVITFEDGTKLYIETKGYLDDAARRKMVAVRKANPELDIRILFVKDNLIRKNAKSKYSHWAERVGFPYAFKKIPLEWLRLKNKEENIAEDNPSNS